MKLFILLCAIFFINTVAAQNTWIVQSGKNILLKAAEEDTTANVIAIKRSKITSLVVSYAEPRRKDWSRYIMVYDRADNELISKETYNLSLSASVLKNWAKKNSQVKIYTIPRNLNPAIAIKVRRVHLCTINFQ